MESTNRRPARILTSRQSQLHPSATVHWLQRPDSHHLTKKLRFLEYRESAPKDLDDRGKRRVVAEYAYIAGLHHTRAARIQPSNTTTWERSILRLLRAPNLPT
jgi:sirohydrochlorin ferrochelatase